MDAFVDDLAVPIAVVVEGSFVYANVAFTKHCQGAVVGRACTEVFADADRPTVRAAIDAAASGQSRRHQVTGASGHVYDLSVAPTTFAAVAAVSFVLEDVSMRQILTERLMESENRFQRLVSGAADAIVAADARGRIVLWNESATRIFGYAELDVLGEPFAMLFPPDSAQGYGAERFAANDVPNVATTIVSLLRKDGSQLDARMSLASSDYGGTCWFTAVIQDDSERQQLLDSLARSEASFRALVESSPDPIFVHGPNLDDFEIVYANAAMKTLVGYERLVGCRSLDTFVHPDDRAKLMENRRRRCQGEVFPPTSLRWLHRDGTMLHVQATSRRVRFDDRAATLVYARDLTQELRMEEQLRQTQKMEAVGLLAGGIAHDFNNILAVILSNADLALEALGRDHQIAQELSEIEEASTRAAALTRQLLAFSRKERRQPKHLALNAVVTNVEKMLSRIVGEDIAISALLATKLGTIEADAGQLEQLLMNLVVNARDAMPSGGRVMIETSNVVLDAQTAEVFDVAAGPYVMLSVTDTGCGMDETVRARIFEPFFTTKEVGKGTGLGLSTVFGIVKQSGGAIAVDSKVGRGTTFRIYFPRIDGSAATTERRDRFVAPRGTGTVLVVEDDEQVRSIIRRYLSTWGYNLLEAPNGAAALDVARNHAGSIDLLLTDLVMPEMDGRSLSKQVLATRPSTRVVFMSGYTEHPALRDANLGAHDVFMPKPFTARSLAETIQRALAAQM